MDPNSPTGYNPPRTTEQLAVVSLVLGIAGWVTGLSLLFWIPGVVLGHMARTKIRQNPSLDGDGLAVGGLVTSYMGLGLFALALVGLIVFLLLFTMRPTTQGQVPVELLPQVAQLLCTGA